MSKSQPDRRAFLAALAALGTGGVFRRPARAEGAKEDALALARKVEAVYGACRTYRDTGRLSQSFVSPEGKDLLGGKEPKPTALAFVRPGKFRFEYDGKLGARPIRHLIWMDGPEVKTWWDIRPGVETPGSLDFALGAAAGVSGSSSVTIPPLLLHAAPVRAGALSAGPGELSLLDDEAIGPNPCRRLRRRNKAVNFQNNKEFEVVTTYWIDPKTSAVRRVVQEMQLDQGRAINALDLEPEFDAEIPADALAFDPPAGKP